jgi:hypothetical protein
MSDISKGVANRFKPAKNIQKILHEWETFATVQYLTVTQQKLEDQWIIWCCYPTLRLQWMHHKTDLIRTGFLFRRKPTFSITLQKNI